MSMFGKTERLYADARAGTATGGEEPKEPVAAPPPKAKPSPVVVVRVNPEPKPERNFRGSISTGLELAGIASVSIGGFLLAPWVGCIMLGVLLIALGVATGYGA